ncbi:hypothetical protein C8D99_101237 [Aminivibrio pyruvatiphilus]|uniref:Uncharacterized protein n=1 Tax=Aminivibrio pyruvatiphilus TaxID=1005740 RepID=A0A4R8MK80_9BACT|nr:hypothetical protein [Aminivibrio pyruvatiphilus]TDY65087.1 hypothetical protein C8D99_101237 [Aminivibrio pyruvatiphilus]
MEKKIARITRWLDRCAKACSARSWQSALLDMECAKAELDEARSELWARAEGGSQASPVIRKAGRLTLTAALGLFLVLSVAGPLAVQTAREAVSIASGPSLEWVSTDEKALLSALRRSLSDANLARLSAEPGDKIKHREPAITAAARPSDNRRNLSVLQGRENENLQNGSSSGREFDTIITLVQIGQKALRERESAIRFDAP